MHMTRQLKIDDQRYSLCSVVVQRGTAHAGHYWSICRHQVNQEETWWVYNDAEKLRVATEPDIDAPGDSAGAAHSYIAFYVQANEEIPRSGNEATSAGDPIQQRQQIADLLSMHYAPHSCGTLQNWQTYSKPWEILNILRVGVASAPSVTHVALEQIFAHHRNALVEAQRLVGAESEARAQAQKEAEDKAAHCHMSGQLMAVGTRPSNKVSF